MIEKLIPLISTIGGALVGALVAYLVARQQFKANVLSKNRQEWINTLRELLAEHEAILYNIHADFKAGGALRNKEIGLSEIIQTNLIRSKVQLMINPEEDDHTRLHELMRQMFDSACHAEEEHTKRFSELDNEFISLAQSILKREWKRVKRGK